MTAGADKIPATLQIKVRTTIKQVVKYLINIMNVKVCEYGCIFITFHAKTTEYIFMKLDMI